MTSPLRVLVVEDDLHLLEFYKGFLRDAGHAVRAARNGREGLDALDWMPDVILLDLLLPLVDGHEFLRQLRARPEHRQTPVIVLSAATSPSQRAVSGAQALLPKPFDFDRLLLTIDGLSREGAAQRRLT